MRGESALSHIYRPVRCGVSRARHARKDPRRGARRPRDRIRVACRFEAVESRPRSWLRADLVAQRVHGASRRVAEGSDALTEPHFVRRTPTLTSSHSEKENNRAHAGVHPPLKLPVCAYVDILMREKDRIKISLIDL